MESSILAAIAMGVFELSFLRLASQSLLDHEIDIDLLKSNIHA
jgi:hypothetical protein